MTLYSGQSFLLQLQLSFFKISCGSYVVACVLIHFIGANGHSGYYNFIVLKQD